MKKKKWIVLIAIVLLFLMLIPIPLQRSDGGTVVHKAVLYEVWDVHRMTSEVVDGERIYIEGWIISVLGIEVYNSAGITIN